MLTPKKKVLASGKCSESLADYIGSKHQLKACRGWQVALLVALFVGLFSQGLYAQENGTASVTGVVADPSGASIIGASVTVTNTATGVAISATSNEAGVYTVLYLIPGNYNVEAKKDGFQTQVKSDILLTADRKFGLNFQLNAGSFTEKVTVQANAQLLETETAALGQTIDEATILELPLNGRNPASLVALAPGEVDLFTTFSAFVPLLQTYLVFPTEQAASSNGGREGSTVYLLDGGYNVDSYELTAGPFPNPDAIQEFKVISNNSDPRYGFAPDGAVSIATKSGTNAWHGDLFEFIRNRDLNAKYWLPPHNLDGLIRNQFGASIGGPILKDKLFIFGNYQGTRQRTSNNNAPAAVPTQQMLQGDFSGICVTGFDVNGVCQDPGGTGQIYQDTAHTIPYKNNFISNWATAYSPGAVALNKVIDVNPPASGTGLTTLPGISSIQRFDEFTVRTDYNINNSQRIMLRDYTNIFNQPAANTGALTSHANQLTTWTNMSASHTWTITPKLVNSVIVSFLRINDGNYPGKQGPNGTSLCYHMFIKVNDSPDAPCVIEGLSVGNPGAYGFSAAESYSSLVSRNWGVSDSLNIVKGKHLIVAGVDAQRLYSYEQQPFNNNPQFNFDGSYTNNPFADFLLGDVAGFGQGSGEINKLHQNRFAPYVVDAIKVTPHLTVTAGVRWEPWFAPTIASGRTAEFRPGQQSTRYPNAPVGVVYPGDTGVPPNGVSNSLNQWDPRVGFAWAPDFLPKTTIRAAAGAYSAPIELAAWDTSGDNPPFSPSYGFGHTDPKVGPISFDNPWAVDRFTGGVSPFPPFFDAKTVPPSSAPFTLGSGLAGGFSQHWKGGQNDTWNLSLTHQFGTTWVAEAAYVGAEAYHLSLPMSRNPGQYFGPGNPNNGAMLFPNLGGIAEYDSIGTSSYEGGQFSLKKRFANGLQFQASYTRSKTLDTLAFSNFSFSGAVADPYNLENDRGLSELHVPDNFAFNYVYHAPTLRNRNVFVRNALGGWESSGIWTMREGGRYSVFTGQDNSFFHTGSDRADLVPGQQPWSNRGNAFDMVKNGIFNAAAFTLNAPGTVGNSARNIFADPRIDNVDMSIDKNWNFRERYRVQLRWEMFNAFNHVLLGPGCNYIVCGSLFGKVFVAGPSRVQQGALKIYF